MVVPAAAPAAAGVAGPAGSTGDLATRPPYRDPTAPSSARRPAPAPAAATGDAPAAPLITLGRGTAPSGSFEWVKWIFLLAIAIASAVLAFLLIPDNLMGK
jgi:hypothetical protein